MLGYIKLCVFILSSSMLLFLVNFVAQKFKTVLTDYLLSFRALSFTDFWMKLFEITL